MTVRPSWVASQAEATLGAQVLLSTTVSPSLFWPQVQIQLRAGVMVRWRVGRQASLRAALFR